MNIDNYYFPVEEKRISLHPGPVDDARKIGGYKAIVRPGQDQDTVISVVKDTYQLVPNRELIEPFLEEIDRMNVNWIIDPSHSFVTDHRMRLQVTFPDFYLYDGQSDIPLSLYLHNFYDMSEGIRLFWGAIRSICSNGLVFGNHAAVPSNARSHEEPHSPGSVWASWPVPNSAKEA